MIPWMEWGLSWISAFQTYASRAEGLMHALSLGGTEYFYFLTMPAVVWCLDSGLGVRAGLLLVTSAGVNDSLKIAFGLPRPYWVSRDIAALSGEASFGLPSGHAQSGVVLWGRLAAWARRAWFTTAAALVVLGISTSRVFLGVHFPLDVVAGWAFGLTLLGLAVAVEEPVRRRLGRLSLATQIGLVALAAAAMIGLGALSLRATEMQVIPAVWVETAARASAEPIDPRSMEPFVARAGALFGLGSGAALLAAWGRFHARTSLARSAARYLVGVAGVVILFLGLRAASPASEAGIGAAFRFLRYAAVGFWIIYGAPRVFHAVGLSSPA